MAHFKLSNKRPFRLIASRRGKHRFGGPSPCGDIFPLGMDVPVHHILTLDLSDQLVPIENDGGATRLPLYYPLKYGGGGPSMQYAVRSDDDIEILYLSETEPDDEDE